MNIGTANYVFTRQIQNSNIPFKYQVNLPWNTLVGLPKAFQRKTNWKYWIKYIKPIWCPQQNANTLKWRTRQVFNSIVNTQCHFGNDVSPDGKINFNAENNCWVIFDHYGSLRMKHFWLTQACVKYCFHNHINMIRRGKHHTKYKKMRCKIYRNCISIFTMILHLQSSIFSSISHW